MHVHLNGQHILRFQNITLPIEPQVASTEAFWDAKKKGHNLFPGKYEEIHMPNNSGMPIIMSAIFFVWGFSFVFAIMDSCDYRNDWIFVCMALPFI